MRKLAALFAAATLVVGLAPVTSAQADGIVPIKAAATARAVVPTDTKQDKGDRVPPRDPRKAVSSRALAAPADPSYQYWFAGGDQTGLVANEGVFAGTPVWTAYKHADELHSIVSAMVIDTTSTLGGGSNVIAFVYGRNALCSSFANPCVLAEAYVNGVWQGWNSAHFVDYAGTSLNLGDTVSGTTETTGCTSGASARNMRIGVRKNTTTGGWMPWADLCYGDATAGAFLGEYPATLFTSIGESMPSADRVTVFSESNTWYDTTDPDQDGYGCTDLGSGYLANANNGPYPASGQRIADVTMPNTLNSAVNMSTFAYPQDGFFGSSAGAYEAHPLSTEPPGNVRYYNVGGPGFSGVQGNTVPGVQGGC
jgi:hypothetical protein